LNIPVWLWGIVYYAVLICVIFVFRPAVFWLVMVGLGVEVELARMLIAMQWLCIFCLANAVVVVLLAALNLRRDRGWQALAICLLMLVFTHVSMGGTQPAPQQPQPDRSIVARVGDATISAMELESMLASRIYRIEQSIYKIKRERLDELIDDILLQKAAQEKGISFQAYLESIESAIPGVDNEEVTRYYRQNRSQFASWKGSQKDLIDRIGAYLRENKRRHYIKEITRPLRDKHPVSVYLEEPPLPFSQVSIGQSPVWGPGDAPVTVVEFSDYLCPACRRVHKTTKEVKERYAGKIRWVFKDYPLKRHKGAKKLAEAAHCAGEQGRFWEFQDLLFAAEKELELEDLTAFARDLGLDNDRFVACYQSDRFKAQVEQHIKEARASGVSSTPTFIINGRLKPGGLLMEDFEKILEDELKKTR
jgi:protein-disulfide isomerase